VRQPCTTSTFKQKTRAKFHELNVHFQCNFLRFAPMGCAHVLFWVAKSLEN
jgi:hypothetical protein